MRCQGDETLHRILLHTNSCRKRAVGLDDRWIACVSLRRHEANEVWHKEKRLGMVCSHHLRHVLLLCLEGFLMHATKQTNSCHVVLEKIIKIASVYNLIDAKRVCVY
jgi:hypothetical protein